VIVFSFVLVLAALGLLVLGLLGASQPLIWGSIVASATAGVCLVVAVIQQRRVGRGDPAEIPPMVADLGVDDPTTVVRPMAGEPAWPPAHTEAPRRWSEDDSPGHGDPSGTGPERTAHDQQGGDSGRATVEESPDEPFGDPPDEPAEEQPSAADVLRTADLTYDVLVVDGRPRYHLVGCTHLRDREPVPLPLAEARETGFTPCSLCRPDSTLAGRTRERFGGE
jgi:hypothetical protein